MVALSCTNTTIIDEAQREKIIVDKRDYCYYLNGNKD